MKALIDVITVVAIDLNEHVYLFSIATILAVTGGVATTTEKSSASQTTPAPTPATTPGTTTDPTRITSDMLATRNYPKAAFYLASIGGVLMLVAGLFAIFFNALYLAIVWSIWAGLTSLIIGIGLIICSLFVSGGAASLVLKPEAHRSAGATIVIFSILALFMGFGWIWLFGSALGIIGGILAIVWRYKPTVATTP